MMMLLMVMALLMTSDGVSVPLDKPILLRLVRQSPVSLPRAGDESLDQNSDGFEDVDGGDDKPELQKTFGDICKVSGVTFRASART